MNLSKPTALAAFAAKQQLLDDLGIPDGGKPGKAVTQLKIPSLKAFDGASDVGANHKQLKQLNPLGGGVLTAPVKPLKALNALHMSDGDRGSPSRKLVEMSTALTPMPPLKSTEVDKTRSDGVDTHNVPITASSPRLAKTGLKTLATTDNDGNGKSLVSDSEKTTKKVADYVAASDANTAPTQDETTQKEREVISTKLEDSDDDNFDFDDSDDAKENAKYSEEKASSPPSATELRPTSVDVEELYDCPPEAADEASHSQQRREPKMFLPRASDIELFQLVLTEDTDQLERYLQKISPQEILEIVDANERTLYHYAALSKDKLVQDLIFQHVNSCHDAQFEMEVQALMRKKAQMNAWMQDTEVHGKEWIPPRVKELQRETTKQKCADWARICARVDENGRSLFHYISTTTSLIPIDDNYELCSVLRAQPNILSAKDKFKKLALHYAVETGNLKLVKWFFQMIMKLNQADVDLLLSFNMSRVMENVLMRQLEAIDYRKYYLTTSKHSGGEEVGTCDPGVSTFVLAKLQRKAEHGAGRLHQLPIHRAAMFGNIRAVELLLEEETDPNARDANKWTPLHYCADEATARHLAIAQLLVELPKPVDINAKSLKGRSPLHIAVRSRKHKIRNNNGAEMCESHNRLLFVTYLHEYKADLDLKDNHGATPLLLACCGDDVDVTRFLLRAGCDPTATGDNKWNPLHFAAIHGNPSMVLFLLSWDADSRLWIDSPGIQGRKPVDISKTDNIRQMLTNLWMECYNGNVNNVRRLLLARSKTSRSSKETGVVSVTDKTAQAERTPLHLAVLGYMNTLEPPHDERPKHAKSSELKRSAPGRYLQTAVLLLQAGADLCAADKWGITPLMLAAGIKDAIFMETLLDRWSKDSNLLVTDADGNAALHHSYAFCQAQISTMLEDLMDDSDIENKLGKSPFEMTGYRDKIYPKGYLDFQRQQQDLRNRSCK
ncbi:hypothetical protein L915_06009 [Phytophthora nicotianae]|uniref:Uncharacterized protein n=1 Tax=Phytophthora nicotianae TaxID=4792 RepID=W2H4G7_PHYNI|nr:hypothetical protein L915_06009 [Phytophthora nicotianae]